MSHVPLQSGVSGGPELLIVLVVFLALGVGGFLVAFGDGIVAALGRGEEERRAPE